MTTESSVSAGEASWTEAEATQWRSMLGTGAALWAGGGRIEVEPGWWLAFSGARTVDYNVILCHGPDAKRDVTRSLEEVRAAKVPAVIMLGGQALGMANLLAEEGWVCVDTKPVMIMRPLIGEHDPAARRLRPEDLPEAHRLICSAFDTVPEFAEIALPSAAAENPTCETWGLFDGGEMVTCTGGTRLGETQVMWSLATPPERQRRGYGRRLISSILAEKHDAGVTTFLFWASPPGMGVYRSLGAVVIEYLQVWSRARWVFPPV